MHRSTQTDLIVVGTGPGGATVAREMSRRGASVLMLEWGGNPSLRGSLTQFARAVGIPGKSLLVTPDLCAMVRGITTGGSSVFYYATAFDPPLEVFDRHGIDLRPQVAEIRAELPTRPLDPHLMGPMAGRIMASARDLGLDWRRLPKFIHQERCQPGCWRCQYGCPQKAKWNAGFYVEEALEHGARLVNGAAVEAVLVDKGRAQGVVYRQNGNLHRVCADTVVLAAGGIGTPLILRKSGVAEAGRNFFFDPLITVMGWVDKVEGGREIPMAAGMHAADEGYVMTDMTVPSALHWALNARIGRLDQLHRHSKTLQIMIKIKDRLGGAITDRGAIRKRLTAADKRKFAAGYTRAREILSHAGARGIHRSGYLAAHPGGTAKVGHLVDTDLKTGIERLYVCDASVLPEAWGVPPTFSLIALGKRLATHLGAQGPLPGGG